MKSNSHKTLALVTILIALIIVVTNVNAQSQSDSYWLIDLGALPGDVESAAFDINNPGQVVGRSTKATGAHHAVLWDNGTITDLGMLPDDDFSQARAINNRGEIVGLSGHHAVLWDNGTITDLGALAAPGAGLSGAFGNNDRGQVVGFSVEVVGAALWTR